MRIIPIEPPSLFDLVGLASPSGPPPRLSPRLMNPRPVVVSSAMDAAAVMTQLRLERGWTGEDLDARVGWADRYTAKMENPDKPTFGKRGLHISQSWEEWAQALGVCLVIVTKEQARQIGAVPAPVRVEGCGRRGVA